MKKPSTQTFKKLTSLALLTVLGTLFVITVNFSEGVEKYSESEEEGEGMPIIMTAFDHWGEMRTYPFKVFNASRFTGEFAKSKQMPRAEANGRIAGTSTAPWTALAPKNFAGRTLALGFHPTNPNIMWAGSAGGGLWKTTTGGTGAPGGINWTYVPTGFPAMSVMAIAVNPSNGNEIYVGTGEVYNNGAASAGQTGAGHIRTYRGSYGIGILKSTDGGSTWDTTLSFAYSNLVGVADIVIDPNNSLIVYAATSVGIYRTINGGISWTKVLNVPMAMDLIYKPGSSTVLYATCGNFATTGAGIYKCTNADNSGSPTFNILSTGLPTTKSGKIMLAISPANTSKIYASIGADPNATSDPEGMWVSTDEGANWSQPTATNMIGTQGWYAHDVAVDPTAANTVYWGELNLYKSTNGGSTGFTSAISSWSAWYTTAFAVGTRAEGDTNSYVHADIHRMYATAANTLYLCTDGGIFRTTDGGATFHALNGGMQTAQIYCNMGQSMQDANFMVGGLQDNEGFVYQGNPNCKKIGNLGDGFHSAVDPTNDNICFTESYYLNAKKSTNKGGSFASMSGSAAVNLGNPPSETVCFNAPLVIAPSAVATMYAGSCKFKRSTNNGGTWSDMNSGNPLSHANAPLIYIAVAPTNASIAYVSVAPGGGQRSKLFRTTNGGTSFTEITGSLPDRYYPYITVDPTDPTRVAVCLSGFTLPGESHIYLSHNSGTSWVAVNGTSTPASLPDVPTTVVKFDPTNRGALYVGNDIGLYWAKGLPTSGTLSSPVAVTWNSYSEGLEDAVMVSDIQFTNTSPVKLRLATYGRGIWERELAPQTLPVTMKDFTVNPTTKGNQLRWTIASQKNVSKYEIQYSTDGLNFSTIGSLPARSGNGDITYTFLHNIQNDVNGFYRIRITDVDGAISFSSIQEVKAKKLVVQIWAYPNPTTGAFKVKIPGGLAGKLTLKVYNDAGKLVYLQPMPMPVGSIEHTVNISHLSAGSYQIVCEDNASSYVTRILKR